MNNLRQQLAVWTACLVFALATCGQSNRDSLIDFSVVGSISASTPANLNPFVVLSTPEVQRVVLDVAEEPRDQAFIDRSLFGSNISLVDIERLGFVRRSGKKYVIGFSLFTRQDEAKIHATSEAFAKDLASRYASKWSTFDSILSRYSAKGVGKGDLAFVLLGCFSLDWDALIFTAEKNYRSVTAARAGGYRYTVSATEKGESSIRRIYWGSTTDTVGNTAFTSFGDHHALPRNAFPDLSFRLYERAKGIDGPPEIKTQLIRAAAYSIDGISENVAAVMRSLRVRPTTQPELAATLKINEGELANILSLLVGLEYIQQRDSIYFLRVPVLLSEDARIVNDLRAASRELFEKWLAENFESIKTDLQQITPLRYGVPFDEMFTHIWHYIFGLAIREMVSHCLLADPYAGGRRYKGFIPVVWDTSVATLP